MMIYIGDHVPNNYAQQTVAEIRNNNTYNLRHIITIR